MYLNSAEDVERELDRKLKEAEAIKAGWEKVTFPKKKDGKEFSNMAKNFEGAYYRTRLYCDNKDVKELEIVCRDNGGYYSDSINCYDFDEKRPLSFDEIKKEIENQIAAQTKKISILKADLEQARNIYTNFKQSIDSLVDGLKQATGYQYDKELYGLITEAISGKRFY